MNFCTQCASASSAVTRLKSVKCQTVISAMKIELIREQKEEEKEEEYSSSPSRNSTHWSVFVGN